MIAKMTSVLLILSVLVVLAPGAPAVSQSGFTETFDGNPSSPQPFKSHRWDVSTHFRQVKNNVARYKMDSMAAEHGSNCSPPPATHSISNYEDAVYKCRGHVMTAINASSSGYGLVEMTPAFEVDFSNGPATIRWDMSTRISSRRDWVSVYISPMEDHLQMPLHAWFPDLHGNPKRAVAVEMNPDPDRTAFKAFVIRNHNPARVSDNRFLGYQSVLTPSATERSTFEIQISETRLKVGMPDYNIWWIDTSISSLGWTRGVVQFGHHSYTPLKGCDGISNCRPNTWHWDNISINRGRPFTIIGANRRFTEAANGGTLTFDAPSPAGSHLRFMAMGTGMQVSFNGGSSWQNARMQAQGEPHSEGMFANYWMSIPSGVRTVHFRGNGSWMGPWHVRDASIWAAGGSAPPPADTPTPEPPASTATATPTATHTSVAPTATRAPTPTPTASPTPDPCVSEAALRAKILAELAEVNERVFLPAVQR